MKLVRQPPGSRVCGQACVATILGIKLEEAIQLVGRKGATFTRNIAKALRARGFHCSGKSHRPHCYFWSAIPTSFDLIMIRAKHRERDQRHWLIYFKGKYLDPDNGVFNKPPPAIAAEWKPTSYLIISKIKD